MTTLEIASSDDGIVRLVITHDDVEHVAELTWMDAIDIGHALLGAAFTGAYMVGASASVLRGVLTTSWSSMIGSLDDDDQDPS